MKPNNYRILCVCCAFCLSLLLSGCEEHYGEGSSLLRLAFSIQGSVTSTRSTPTYTENLGDFDATAYLNKSSQGVYDDVWSAIRATPFTKDDKGIWSHSFTNNESWPDNNAPLVFFLHYPLGSTVGKEGTTVTYSRTDGGKNVIHLNDFVTPGRDSDTAAEEQVDHAFATTLISESTAPAAGQGHAVLFYHPFAAVKFQTGTVRRVDSKSITAVIKGIALKNVYDKGSCTLTPYYGQQGTLYAATQKSNAGGAANTKSAACVQWSIDDTSMADFHQTFTAADNGTTPQAGLFPAGFTTVGQTTKPNAADTQLNTDSLSKTFIVIPQTFDGTNHRLSMMVDIELDGLLYSREVPITTPVEWKAGGLYTYQVNLELTEIGWNPTIQPVGWYEAGNITDVYVPQNESNE